ncbi:sulfatase [bacterium]|nr:sulfatase [candidate division CSSED10-310 bacterium]
MAGLVLLVTVAWSVSADEGRFRNCILVTFDTLRADHLSCYGYPRPITPALDRFAKNALTFSDTLSQIPLTGPGHATIMTAHFAHQHGAVRNGIRILPDEHTMAELFKAQGYVTAAFLSGWTLKSHLCGLNKGFDLYDDTMTDRYRVVNSQRFADQVTDEALRWLAKDRKEPFFMWLHYFDPHWPYAEHPHFRPSAEPRDYEKDGRYKSRITEYNIEIAFTDRQFDRVMHALHRTGLDKTTCVVVTADHGESFGEHNYLGHGRRVYNPGLHIPFMISYPGMKRAGEITSYPAQQVDFLPTVTMLAGMPDGGIKPMGESLVPVLNGDPATGREKVVFFETYSGAAKLVPKSLKKKAMSHQLHAGFRVGAHKHIMQIATGWLQSYDLDNDPGELSPIDTAAPARDQIKTTIIRMMEDGAVALEADSERDGINDEDREILQTLGYIE